MENQYSIIEKEKILQEAAQFLTFYRQTKTAEHCAAVAAEAKRLAEQFGEDPIRAELAGYLHDISAVIPTPKRVTYAMANRIEILPEERKAPMILHQKISVIICRDVFGISDAGILSAVGCHTTLKAEASTLDKIVFLADKIAWDQAGEAPFHAAIQAGLKESLDAGVMAYLDYLWSVKDTLLVVHPWFLEAREAIG